MESKGLKFLLSFLAPYRLQIAVIFIAITIVSSSILGLGYALRYLIDQGFVGQDITSLNIAFFLLLVVIILISLSSYLRSLRVNWICEQLEANIKQDIYKHIINLSPSFFEFYKISDVYSRLTSDVNLICNNLVMIFSFSLRNCFMAIGGLALLLINNIKLTSYVLLILPFILVPIIFIGRKVRKLSKDNQNAIAECNSHIEENLCFITTIQSYGNEMFEFDRFCKINNKSQNIAYKRIKLRSLLFALVISLILSAIALVLWIGGHDVISGEMTAGSLSSFIFYSVIVALSIGGLSEVYSDLQRSRGALDRVIELAQSQSPVKDDLNGKSLNLENKFEFSLQNLSFSYQARPEVKVLDRINLQIKNGQTIAIVGPSGAGKSTIFQLLQRFYDPTGGLITINNVDIKTLKLATLRSLFAFVSQEPVIFSGTAYYNISYGKINASKEEVIEAAKAAEIFDFFDSLPEGLNTYVGEKGAKLSGGQKQRIAIARAIIRNPQILLLDEATSALDNENEKLVQSALSNLSKNRTTIVIAHRISTIINADMIVVLDQGKIVDIGSHKELLVSCPLYKKLNQDSFISS